MKQSINPSKPYFYIGILIKHSNCTHPLNWRKYPLFSGYRMEKLSIKWLSYNIYRVYDNKHKVHSIFVNEKQVILLKKIENE